MFSQACPNGGIVSGAAQQVRRKKIGVSNILALSAVVAMATAGTSRMAHAAMMASDNAGNSPYIASVTTTVNPQGWLTGMNGGSGFGPWTLADSSTGGDFIQGVASTDTYNGILPWFDIWDTSTAPNANQTSATRPFTGGALAVGQSFSFDFVLNAGATGCQLGFYLGDSGNNPLFKFYQTGNSPINGIVVDGSGQTSGIGVPYNYHSFDHMVFTLTSPTTYNFDVNGSLAYSGSISNATGGITQATFFNNGGGGFSDVLFTNLAVSAVPAPSTLLIFAGGIGLAAMALRRRVDAKV